MNIVVLDGYTLNPGDNPWDELARLGTLVVHDRTPAGRIVERARGAAIVLTNKTPLGEAELAQLPELRCIGVLATGYNVVDVGAARRRGIAVTNVPEYGTDSVAQHVFALLLELCHRVGQHDAAVKAGEWTASPDFCFWKAPLIELAGLTIGIVGFGRIGRRVGELAHAFGMRVLASGGARRPSPSYAPFAWRDIPDLFAQSDVITLHCPLTAENAGFVDAALLARVRRRRLPPQHRPRRSGRRGGTGGGPALRPTGGRGRRRRLTRADRRRQPAAGGAALPHYAAHGLGQPRRTPPPDGDGGRERARLPRRAAGESGERVSQ